MAEKKLPQWLQGCSICNVGLCARVDEIIAEGKTFRAATRILEAEAFEANGHVLALSREAIRQRYRDTKGLNVRWDRAGVGKPPIEDSLRRALGYINSAKNKLIVLNGLCKKEGVEQIDGVEAILAKVDLAKFIEQFVTFIQYFQGKGLLNESEANSIRKIESGKSSK